MLQLILKQSWGNYDRRNVNGGRNIHPGRSIFSIYIDKQEYCIEIKYVTEIVGIQKITDLPDVPHFIKGVINLRGKVIPVLDVRLRFGMKEREYDARTSIMVVNIKLK